MLGALADMFNKPRLILICLALLCAATLAGALADSFELLIDHGGTPQDPSDDEFLADLGLVFGSTGRNDDFCGAVVPALSG